MLGAGDKLGPYVILSALGAGGMGEVYRATDTRLHRTVALKVLSGAMQQRQDMQQRLQREARAVSQLTHPHICTLLDVGQQDGLDYIVMEYLEGETLESRLKKGPLSAPLALSYGIQIAGALDRAHQSGIVHRDLKPGNVILTKDGAKLVDFGLARVEMPSTDIDPTQSLSLTGGQIVGTLPYMAPEQVEAKPVDARTDVFAFGSLLFEMLSGRRAFAGESRAALMAEIVSAEPPSFASLDIDMPASLERLVRTCLAKNPEERWQSMRDIALAAQLIAQSPAQRSAQKSGLRWGLRACLAGVVLGGIAILIAWLRTNEGQTASPLQLEIAAPNESEFSSFGSAISPNGHYVAFVAITRGRQRLWLRSLDSRDAQPLEDTEDAQLPFWAPDSSSIGFFTGNKLKRFDLTSRATRTIAPVTYGMGGTWNRDGVIVYASRLDSPLQRVPATGGDPSPASVLSSSLRDQRHNFPQFLPDGKHFIFFAYRTDPRGSGPQIGSLDDPTKSEPISQLAGNPFQATHSANLPRRYENRRYKARPKLGRLRLVDRRLGKKALFTAHLPNRV